MGDKMIVYKAIASVMAELAKMGIAKNDTNTYDNYKYRGIDAVYNALAPLLAKNGLCVLPRVVDRDIQERTSAKGGALFHTTLTVEFDLVSSDDGTKHTIRAVGEGMDRGDKSVNKAMTAAYKYAMFEMFCIPTEGDDADSESHEVDSDKLREANEYAKEIPTATAERLVEIGKKLAGLGIPQDKLSELRDAWAKRNKELSGK